MGTGRPGSIFRAISTLETIVEDLRTLLPTKLEEAAALIHGLRETACSERSAALERSATILTDAEGRGIGACD